MRNKLSKIVFLLVMTVVMTKVYAFHEHLDSVTTTQEAAYPESGLFGQTYKYATSGLDSDNPKRFAVFCTAYSLPSSNGNCDLVDSWSEATKAGVARIIDEYSFNNYAISTVNNNSDLLKKKFTNNFNYKSIFN